MIFNKFKEKQLTKYSKLVTWYLELDMIQLNQKHSPCIQWHKNMLYSTPVYYVMTWRLQYIQYLKPKRVRCYIREAKGLVFLTLMNMLFLLVIRGDIPSEESQVIVWAGKAKGHWGECGTIKHMIRCINVTQEVFRYFLLALKGQEKSDISFCDLTIYMPRTDHPKKNKFRNKYSH